MRSLIFLILLKCCFQQSWSQTKSTNAVENPTLIGVNFDYAYFIEHSDALEDVGNAFPRGISLEWSKHLLSQQSWEFCNCFPRYGVDVSYWDFDSDILGQGFLGIGFLEPYFRTHKPLNLIFRMGLGVAYQTKPFDQNTNPNNFSYSTNLSFALNVGLGMNYKINETLNLRMLAKFNHTSNGGVKEPNKGINFPSLSIGLNKSFKPYSYPNYDRISTRNPPPLKKYLSLTHFSGWNDTDVGDNDMFYVFGLAAKYSRWIGGRSALSVGTELILDYKRREQIRLEDSGEDFTQAALLVGHEFWLGKVIFSQQLGIYYYNDYRVTDDVYQRYALTYNFSDRLFGGVGLKAHRHVADFLDLRIGYKFF